MKPTKDLLTTLESEVLGESFFRSAYYTAFFSNRRNKIKALWQLEVQTKKRILEYFRANNIEIPKLKWLAVKGSIFGLFYPAVPWRIVMKEIFKETEYYLKVFCRLEQQAKEKDKELFKYIVTHELAIASFAEIELKNSNNDSLELIKTLLNN